MYTVYLDGEEIYAGKNANTAWHKVLRWCKLGGHVAQMYYNGTLIIDSRGY